ncbi:NP1 [Rhinolophus pusillus bocaparvovirus 2]|uniref:NP1 n=1 Tax=Rhinolophus pusillus bocaparvovirus 2 TaxID=2053080 RepID=UPI000CA293C1|nr:NP1 [Rhinolophus pusillus bocaparvovirus 2]ATV81492.1 NP1 [Rhinolophus pusillus bocaparvovirus 2]
MSGSRQHCMFQKWRKEKRLSPLTLRGSRRSNGESSSASSGPMASTSSHARSTASSHWSRPTARETPIDFFMRRRSETPDAPSFCGFYWHSTRLTRAGTDFIFNMCQEKFQARAVGGKINWDDCKEILFDLKRCMDEKYRKMMWHYSQGGICSSCLYWDEQYRNRDQPAPVPEVTDVEMLEAAQEVEAMEVDGANQ